MTPHSRPKRVVFKTLFLTPPLLCVSEGGGLGSPPASHSDQAVELWSSVERIMQILNVLPRDYHILVINKRKNVITDMIL